jgi:hypothetical protein
MPRPTARTSSFIATATLAAAVTALLGWPARVNADGKAMAAVVQQSQLAEETRAPQNTKLANNEAKLGDLVISAELAKSETTPGQRVVHLTCRNPTAQRISGNVDVELTRTRGIAMERVMPAPQIAWRHQESVAVDPGETLNRDVPIPKALSAEIARIDSANERAARSDKLSPPNIYFGVYAAPIEPARAHSQSRKNSAASNTLALAL